MTARPATAADRAHFLDWLTARGRSAAMALPAEGWVVPGVAGIFLEQTAPDRAWIEPAATNPGAPIKDRGAALALCLHEAENAARARGVKCLMAFTDRPAIERFGDRQGYKTLEGALIRKDL